MPIRFQTADGRTGSLDVANLAAEEMSGTITGVKQGLVHIKNEDGIHAFSLGRWAADKGVEILSMDGFNSPNTALDQPPNGMNYLDQAAFYHDGKNLEALQEMFPQSMQRSDGRVVVLDNDGLWKTMWSPLVTTPLPPASFAQRVKNNEVHDPRMVIRFAGITLFFALAGKEVKNDKKHGGVKPEALGEVLKIISRNAPHENKFQIGKLMHQTTGVEPWKLYNALLDPDETVNWIKYALKKSSFQFRMKQLDVAEVVVRGMRADAQKEFALAMRKLIPLDETKSLMINLKSIFGEFIQLLVGMDLMRDISKTTGLKEWVALSSDSAYDPAKLPQMPEFVDKFIDLLKWMMPIVEDPKLAMARGKKGFKAIISLMVKVDDCIYSLAGVPDSGAKYKMFMALKRVQTQVENKLSFLYQPTPEENEDGRKENPFMQIKGFYSPKREELYKLVQQPKEAWNNAILESLRGIENLERFYENLHPTLREVMKSFAAMDAAYDMQPWVDVKHEERTHDAFSQFNESFGMAPPEAGYLAKNSPRAVEQIGDTLVEGAGILQSIDEAQVRELLRNPFLLANLLKSIMVAAVNREIGTVEVMSKFGITKKQDMYASPDPYRIWEDPEMVQADMDKQVEELMGQIAMEAAIQNQGQQAQDQEAQMMEEQQRSGEEGPPKAGPGPSGPQQKAVPMRR